MNKETIMPRCFAASACCIFLLVSATAFAGGALVNVPLKWTPTTTWAEMGAIDVSGALLTTKVHVDAFIDTRPNPPLVAENREHANNVRQFTTSSDVAVFVGDHLRETLQRAGLNTVDATGDVSISGEVRQFFVTEKSTYKGEISLLIRLKDGDGKELWSGIVTGDAARWGRSYSADNYCEVMSDMMLRAVYNLLSNAGFRAALATH
jgi:hypothetical protein